MATIEEDILAEFYKKLGETDGVTQRMIEDLQVLLAPDSTLKPDDLVRIFAPPAEGDAQ